jgi:ABC-type multidrug transport system fused ATPase/permease subunit
LKILQTWFLMCSFVVLVYLAPKLTLTMLLVIPPVFLAAVYYGRKISKLAKEYVNNMIFLLAQRVIFVFWMIVMKTNRRIGESNLNCRRKTFFNTYSALFFSRGTWSSHIWTEDSGGRYLLYWYFFKVILRLCLCLCVIVCDSVW